MSASRIAIVGAGQAGARAALALRELGHTGPIAVVGDEFEPPYERPPLSKALLGREASTTRIRLHEPEHYRESGIDLLLGRPVTEIQRERSTLVLDNDTELPFDRCILATGGRARSWPGVIEGDGNRVFTLRTVGDAHRLRSRLEDASRIAIIGGGFLGLECADSALAMGVVPTVIEASQQLLPDKMPASLGHILRERHEERGVTLRLGAKVARIRDIPSENLTVDLEDGDRVTADFCLIAIGQIPNIELAAKSGLETGNGIHVDQHCRTSDDRIFAAGDCASFPFGPQGRRVRLESWHNAEQQSRIAAANVLGFDTAYDPLPWFWTDQAGWNIQFLGLQSKDCDLEWVVREWPDQAARRQVWMGLKDGALAAAVAVNSGGDMQPLRALIGRGATIERELLLDPTVKLSKLSKAVP